MPLACQVSRQRYQPCALMFVQRPLARLDTAPPSLSHAADRRTALRNHADSQCQKPYKQRAIIQDSRRSEKFHYFLEPRDQDESHPATRRDMPDLASA